MKRYIGKRLRAAARELLICRKLAGLLEGSSIGMHADRDLVKAQRRYARWRTVWAVLYGWS